MSRKKSKSKNVTKILFIVVIAFSCLCLYIFQMAEFIQLDYNISQTKEKISNLKKENSDLRVAVSQSQNLVNFEEKILQNGYNKIDTIDYLVLPNDVLAAK
ncbi:MAG TPA: hypothetical protein PL093_00580 [Candidatus Pacearchaeota archaeon]|nr:hypothetical protein [Candidatus Pacearchaeota archaeon]HRR94566.1 hypothetical protein [Candidatus Paceibacterota bacterium]HPC30431.1 hypothetical protein [Candidatus Pacearchaeota archaeon]HQG09075.1 hypothetical protein [Candidatus Pacearchaeota archaeon]HQH20058.1 hypothetical protein [Candidatus Pacearchaeota archaeon]